MQISHLLFALIKDLNRLTLFRTPGRPQPIPRGATCRCLHSLSVQSKRRKSRKNRLPKSAIYVELQSLIDPNRILNESWSDMHGSGPNLRERPKGNVAICANDQRSRIHGGSGALQAAERSVGETFLVNLKVKA